MLLGLPTAASASASINATLTRLSYRKRFKKSSMIPGSNARTREGTLYNTTFFYCRFYKAVDRMASMWQERPLSGQEEATVYLESLLKYKHFSHLKIPDNELSLLQYFSIDVIAFLGSSIAIFALLFAFICRKIAVRYFTSLKEKLP